MRDEGSLRALRLCDLCVLLAPRVTMTLNAENTETQSTPRYFIPHPSSLIPHPSSFILHASCFICPLDSLGNLPLLSAPDNLGEHLSIGLLKWRMIVQT